MFIASIWSLSHIRSVFLDRVVHFRKKFGRSGLKLLIEVPYGLYVKVHVLSFNLILITSPQRVPRRSYLFLGNFGRSSKGSFTRKAKFVNRGSLSSAPEITAPKLQYKPDLFSVTCSQTKLSISVKFVRSGKGRSPTKLKSLIEVNCAVQVKLHVLSFNMILISFPQRVLSPSYPFWENFGRSGKGLFTEKAKIVNRGYLWSAREITCSKIQYGPHLISVACSQTELSISGKFWEIRQVSFSGKAKIVKGGSLCSAPESTCSKLHYDPYLISVACSQTELSIQGKFGRSGKGSFAERDKFINRGSLNIAPEITASKFQYESDLFSVTCSQTEFSISVKFGTSGKGR